MTGPLGARAYVAWCEYAVAPSVLDDAEQHDALVAQARARLHELAAAEGARVDPDSVITVYRPRPDGLWDIGASAPLSARPAPPEPDPGAS